MAWSHLTGSEWRLAPSMQPPMTPPDGPTLTDEALISSLRCPQPREKYYEYLFTALAVRTNEVLQQADH